MAGAEADLGHDAGDSDLFADVSSGLGRSDGEGDGVRFVGAALDGCGGQAKRDGEDSE